jgi:hypothetical protein
MWPDGWRIDGLQFVERDYKNNPLKAEIREKLVEITVRALPGPFP